MAAPKPNNVDFSDPKEDKPIGDNMDKMLAEIMKNREMQIANVVSGHNTKQAEEAKRKAEAEAEAKRKAEAQAEAKRKADEVKKKAAAKKKAEAAKKKAASSEE